ncbi:hypothetical protein CTEN210_06628 [Chaetoceros tenuissimus]|uniref:Peptidyl-prolyl cis-trans isomerase n=1 Tax=Chaetoceros tenuissimus TaxID=426638 RepID=A0AAD3CQD9_9STRA|nr:hypothetical protein CTEN210_06628 [Chaetoceros tenuissimus]
MNTSSIAYQIRSFGTRGARGHGWLQKYRAGQGGRHLQGRFHNRDTEKLTQINNQVFELGSSSTFLDIEAEGQTHRIEIELAEKALPNTSENFRMLCQDGLYKQSKVFKIEPKVGLCLGDVTVDNTGRQGSCHESLNEESKTLGMPNCFQHESTVVSHAQKGIVSMLAPGLDQNDSRFMITTVEDAPHLDGRYVAFGRVKQGMDVLEQLVKNTYTKRGSPTVQIQVVDSGCL